MPLSIARLLFLGVSSTSVALVAQSVSGQFVREQPMPAIYHDGWIDLNKDGQKNPYEDPSVETEDRITDLIARMTMEEKTAQMVTLYGFPRVVKDELPTPAWETSLWKDGIGNIDEHMNGHTGWNNDQKDPEHDLPYSLHARAINEVQRWFIERTRLGIPVDFTNEGIRGLLHSKATSFPAELAVASSWNRQLVREIGRATGREARVLGYTNIYSPVLDVGRDPRWGRIIEGYGEDPYLVGALGLEQVRGLQEQRVVSTLKHFAVYSVPKGGRDGQARSDPQVTWRDVQNIFLPPFRRAIMEGGALGVMSSYNDYNGIPVQSSPFFLTGILRQQWGFRGYVVSDSAAVEFIHTKHRTATSPADGIRQVVEAGLNIRTNFTKPEVFAEPLRELVRNGQLSMTTIDSRVRDILRVKYWLGLFNAPYRQNPAEADSVVRRPEHLAIAAKAARESIVLLKNEKGALPLSKDVKRVLVTGPLADDAHGWWSRYGAQKLDFITPLAGIRAKLGANVDVRYAQGVAVKDENYPESDLFKEEPSEKVRAGINAAVEAARAVDVIIAVLGETDELCRESAGRVSLDLPGYQEHLLRALHATGKPVVLVLSNGRPLSVNWAVKHVPAIVELWLPAEEGGAALADILFGDVNPSGHLPVTFSKGVGQIQMNFPAHPGSQGRDPGMPAGVLFPFGHGLSYTTFAYKNLVITPKTQAPRGNIEISCEVSNTGQRAGDDVVQLYLRDDYSSVVTFEKVLRGFERVSLAPGETKTVKFTLTPADLELYDQLERWTVEPGRFTVWVGESSEDNKLEGSFEIVDGRTPREAAPGVTDRTDAR
jgi:beta-glucosidase